MVVPRVGWLSVGGMTHPGHAKLGQLAEKFAQLPDPREQRQPRHLLGDLPVIALCSTLTGGRSFNDMENYGEGHAEWLGTFLLLPQGIPSHDTFNRVLATLDSHALEAALRQWASQCEVPPWDMTLPEHPNALRQLAADGKRLRGSLTRMDQVLGRVVRAARHRPGAAAHPAGGRRDRAVAAAAAPFGFARLRGQRRRGARADPHRAGHRRARRRVCALCERQPARHPARRTTRQHRALALECGTGAQRR